MFLAFLHDDQTSLGMNGCWSHDIWLMQSCLFSSSQASTIKLAKHDPTQDQDARLAQHTETVAFAFQHRAAFQNDFDATRGIPQGRRRQDRVDRQGGETRVRAANDVCVVPIKFFRCQYLGRRVGIWPRRQGICRRRGSCRIRLRQGASGR